MSDRAEPRSPSRACSKHFRIYRQRETTLKETMLRRRRGVYEEFTRRRRHLVRGAARPGARHLRAQRLRQVDAAQAAGAHPRARRGTIDVKGRVAALLEVGAGFHPEYSAIENIFLSGRDLRRVARRTSQPRSTTSSRFAELERFADNPVKTYSSGMYARLGFAIAVNVDPDVLLVDEVLAVGDESFQARCYERMLAFRDAGKTLILVTHDLGAVESFCDARSGSTRAGSAARARPRRSRGATSPRSPSRRSSGRRSRPPPAAAS